MPNHMLLRFSLYGFLKNQQYYEPFIILAFREKGLSFFAIGLLVGFRELCVNILEIPTGAIADLHGRRRSMILSFLSYIVSFSVFAMSTAVWHLFAAMFFFAVGEAFRTGTHKAMILEWLRLQGRESEKTKTYGYTRSWSKMGSAVSVVIAAGLVYYTGRYSDIFWLSIVPYTLGIINFLGYPAQLDARSEQKPSLRDMLTHLGSAFRQVIGGRRLRRILLESMGYETTCKVTADYLQPVIKQTAIALPIMVALGEDKRTAVLVACVYFLLHSASSLASRKSHTLAERLGGESRAARRIWLTTLALFAVMTVALFFGALWAAILAFVLLELARNLWRPILITRVDNETDATMGATMLSIESQSKAAGTLVLAPLAGLAVDTLSAGPAQPGFWVVGAMGALVAGIASLVPTMSPAPAETAADQTGGDQ